MLALLLFLSWASAQTEHKQYTCEFSVTGDPLYPTGVVSGFLRFDWVRHKHDLTYEAGNLYYISSQQVYSYNSNGGYTDTKNQFEFQKTSSCPCSNQPITTAQPPLVYDLTLLALASDGTYSPKASNTGLAKVAFNKTSGFPTSSHDSAGRTFTYTKCKDANFTDATWNPPSGCECGTPSDVVIVLDRSSSITSDLFAIEKPFVQQLVAAFTYGPVATNLGITNFHTLTWDGPVLLKDGTTLAAAKAGANALACAPDPQCHVSGSAGSCCGSGTSVSSGIINGANMLATQSSTADIRKGAAKVLVVFTDGYHDLPVSRTGDVLNLDSAGKPQGKAGTYTPAELTSDIQWAVNYAKSKVPSIIIYAVAAGAAYDNTQLLAITGGDPSKVFADRDWTKLSSFVNQLVATTCTGAAVSAALTCCPPDTCSPYCRQIRTSGASICNDGNTLSGDGCSSTCVVEKGWNCDVGCKAICGDSLKLGKEQCDDGNTKNGDGCSKDCMIETGWTCPDVGKPCKEICGDGKIVGKEKCDDGNTKSKDGCSDVCTVEPGWTCPAPGDACKAICGDGLVVGPEKCDDGNKVSGDGCSYPTCMVELGFTCTTPGKACTDINECDLYKCTPDAYKTTTCRDSTSSGTPKVALDARVCSCGSIGLYVSATGASNGITEVTLIGSEKFPGCTDINECDLYGCGTQATCTDSTTSSVPLGKRVCKCPVPGWRVVKTTSDISATLTTSAVFAGCETICGDGITLGSEECDDGNLVDGDGCSSKCKVETGAICPDPGLKCCEPLPMQPDEPVKCWNGYWVPLGE